MPGYESVVRSFPAEMRAACLLDAGESDQDARDRCRRVHVLVAAALRDTSTSLLRTGNRHVQPRVLLSSSSQSIAALSAPHKNVFFVIVPSPYSFFRQRSNAEMSAIDFFAARRTRVYSAVYVMACSVRACPPSVPFLYVFRQSQIFPVECVFGCVIPFGFRRDLHYEFL